jgi:hypothetical protein
MIRRLVLFLATIANVAALTYKILLTSILLAQLIHSIRVRNLKKQEFQKLTKKNRDDL